MSLRPTVIPDLEDMEDLLTGEPDQELSRMFLAQSLGQTSSLVDSLLPLVPEAG